MADRVDEANRAQALGAADHTVIYRWSIRDVYLLAALAPGLRVVDVRPAEPAHEAFERILASGDEPRRVIVHIDTSMPADFVRPFDELRAALHARGIETWNAAITDIRKTAIQAHNEKLGLPSTRATQNGPGHETLIVKTNLNSRGYPEWALPPDVRVALGWSPPVESPLHGKDGYLVLPREQIPAAWWDDDQAMIERYVDNRYGLFYRTYLAGEAVVLCEGTATTPVRRMRDAGDRYDYLLARELAIDPDAMAELQSPAAEVFAAAVVYAETFGLDFGSIDFVIDDNGVPYVVDVNTTPYWGATPGDGEMLQHLRSTLVG